MATAVETSAQPQAPSPPASLVTASLLGAVYVLAALAVVFYAVPALWEQYVFPTLSENKPADWFLWSMAELAVAVALIWFGTTLIGEHPPQGIRGGIFLMLLALGLATALVLWIGGSADGMFGQLFTAIVGAALLFGAFKLFTSTRGARWMVGLEEQGWFQTRSYKRVLGHKVRRLTSLGLLLLGATGVYALRPSTGFLPETWTVGIPFTQQDGATEGTMKTFALLKYAQYTLPLVLLGLVGWIAYRAVNVPTFAEFLIATEAEMNKVSWTSRKRLTQDTIVVLATTILMALFLLAVDLFWGWLLSSSWVQVLPPKPTDKQGKSGQVQAAKW